MSWRLPANKRGTGYLYRDGHRAVRAGRL